MYKVLFPYGGCVEKCGMIQAIELALTYVSFGRPSDYAQVVENGQVLLVVNKKVADYLNQRSVNCG